MDSAGAPSDWLVRWGALLPPGGHVLDLACGRGRHTRWLAARGHRVTAVDRDADALAGLADLGPAVERLAADLERDAWPLAGRRFDAVVVTNYLWRPLLPAVLEGVRAGGWLVYETFAAGQAAIGRPSRADFLLQPGELLRLLGGGAPGPAGWRIEAYEDTFLSAPDRFVQRIVGQRVAAG